MRCMMLLMEMGKGRPGWLCRGAQRLPRPAAASGWTIGIERSTNGEADQLCSHDRLLNYPLLEKKNSF